MITTKDLIKINQRFGGNLRSDSSLRFAESQASMLKSKDMQMALWIRAIIVDHSFSDGNKRTALVVIRKFKKIKNSEKISIALIKISKENISNLDKIVRIINDANR